MEDHQSAGPKALPRISSRSIGTMAPKIQPQGSPLFIGDWSTDEDFPVFPIGSKPKRMLIAPEGVDETYLIPNHAYLFKSATGWQAQQVWSEVISYRIGAELGLKLPPCFIAMNEFTGETGVLAEFFYGYPGDESPARLVHAADLMTRILADKKRGRPHSLSMNLSMISRHFVGLDESIRWWANAIYFDTLIGNTDRHPENWGFLVRHGREGKRSYEMAPLFDNGTSLGYERQDAVLDKFLEPDRLARYLDRGTHHCSWSIVNDRQAPHFELCRTFTTAYDDAASIMKEMSQLSADKVDAIVNYYVEFHVGIPFSAKRARFISALVQERQRRLRALLDE